MRFKVIFVFIFSVLCGRAFAQTGDIRGFVYFSENAEAAIYTSVYLKGTTYGSTTDLNGFFSISRVPPGNYSLMVTFVGYDTVNVSITIKEDDIITKKLYLKKSVIQVPEIEVSAEKEEAKTDVKVSVTRVTPREIKQVPAIGREPDLDQYLHIGSVGGLNRGHGGPLYIP